MGIGVRSRHSRPLASFAFACLMLPFLGASPALSQGPELQQPPPNVDPALGIQAQPTPAGPETLPAPLPADPNAPAMQQDFRPPTESAEDEAEQQRWQTVPIVQVEARPRLLSDWELHRLLEFQLGALATLEQAQGTVENLLATDRFEFVDIQRESATGGDRLVFLLKPQPYVRKLKLPKSSVRKSRLREWLPIRYYALLDEELVARISDVLGDRFVQAGFPRPAIQVTHTPLDDHGAHRVEIHLLEAKLPRLDQPLRIENKPKGLQLHERIWLWWRNRRDHIWSNPVRNTVHLQEHVDNVVGYLKSQGFVEARGELRFAGTPNSPTGVVYLEPGKRVTLKVKGGKGKHRSMLWDLYWKDGFTVSEMDLARFARKSEEALVEMGYQNGKVEVTRQETEKKHRLTAQIVGGANTVVREIRFEGNESLPGSEIETAMLTGVKGWFPFSSAPYVPRILEEDLESIRTFYALHGFAEADAESKVEVAENGDTKIQVRINEGPHRVVGRVEFSGFKATTEQELILLAKKAGLEPNADLSRDLLGRFARELTLRYVYLGYPDLRVRMRPLRVRGEATDLSIELEEGQQQLMGKLIASGNYKTRTRTILRGFSAHEGERLGPIRTAKLRERVVDLGVFDSVLVETKPEEEGKTDAIVRVQERRSGILDLSLLRDANTGSDSGASLGGEVSLGHENLFGRGLGATVEASAQVREEDFKTIQKLRLAASLRKSSFFGYQLPSTFFTDYIEDRSRPVYDEFRQRVATTISKGFFAKKLQLSTTLSLEETRFELKDALSAEPLPEGSSRSFSIAPRAVFEGRNSFANPTKGTLASLGVKLSPSILGGQTDFVRIDADVRQYIPLGRTTTLALALRGGLLESLSSDPTPVEERFYIGGETSHRSFGAQELGPRDERGRLLGANSFLVANAELRFRLAGELYGGLFTDVGNGFGNGEDFTLRPGFGVGLRYYTIIGPLRGDIGWNPSPREFTDPTDEQPNRTERESNFEFHLAIGHAF